MEDCADAADEEREQGRAIMMRLGSESWVGDLKGRDWVLGEAMPSGLGFDGGYGKDGVRLLCRGRPRLRS